MLTWQVGVFWVGTAAFTARNRITELFKLEKASEIKSSWACTHMTQQQSCAETTGHSTHALQIKWKRQGR